MFVPEDGLYHPELPIVNVPLIICVCEEVLYLLQSPLQKTLSFNLPILGSVGLIDVINYMTHAGGLKVSKKGIAAVGASKFVQGVLPSIGPIQLPTGTSATSSIGSNPSSGAPI